MIIMLLSNGTAILPNIITLLELYYWKVRTNIHSEYIVHNVTLEFETWPIFGKINISFYYHM